MATKPAKPKYFSDCNGVSLEIKGGFYQIPKDEFQKLFPGVKGTGDHYVRNVATVDGKVVPVTRHIWYVSQNPSLHKCDSRCLHGKCGGRCECQCGGVNHGRGA